jgi:hypothetical protein
MRSVQHPYVANVARRRFRRSLARIPQTQLVVRGGRSDLDCLPLVGPR